MTTTARRWVLTALTLAAALTATQAQTADEAPADSTVLRVAADSISRMLAPMDSIGLADAERLAGDTLSVVQQKARKPREKRDWATWKPNPQRALWLALVIPGAGQIYNRKFWKLPIIYGGFLGCIYALTWNNMMYKDYSQAYLDIVDDDPGTASYDKFLHLGKQITEENMSQYEKIFKSRRDKYRRWRDLSFFVMLGVYALSVVDAYVDAELSVFDISKDLSLKVEPAVIPNHGGGNFIDAQSLGLSCKLNF